MLILPGALPVSPPPEQAVVVRQAQSPTKVVEPAAESSKSRNETANHSGTSGGGQARASYSPLPDPNRPTGPPPAFEANLLEAEREKFRAGPDAGPTGAPKPEAKAPETPAYEPPKEAPEPHLDIAV